MKKRQNQFAKIFYTAIVLIGSSSCNDEKSDTQTSALPKIDCSEFDASDGDRLGFKELDNDSSLSSEFTFVYSENDQSISDPIVINGIKSFILAFSENKNHSFCFLGSPTSACNIIRSVYEEVGESTPSVYPVSIDSSSITIQFSQDLRVESGSACVQ
ncbi:MAG: hypothetical protein HRU19_11610 [Pseudobacteriovorax sp.]|nr:hypothetical protein [Pseudobacteriovorax sp.]